MKRTDKPVLVRITTLPESMKVLLKGQISFMRQNGFEVVMISADGKSVHSLEEQEGAKHFTVPLTRAISPVTDLICLFRLTRLLRRIRPDIVHTHTPKAGLIGMWAARFAGVPIRLHTIAGLPWMEYNGLMKRLLKTIERITAFPAHAVFPNSKKQEAFLRSHEIAETKMKVLGNGSSNGIDITHFSPDEKLLSLAAQLRRNSNVHERQWIWIFIGRVVKDKGVGELLSAFVRIKEQFTGDQLWILGNEEPELDPLTEEQKQILHNDSAIKTWGFVDDVRPYLLASAALVFPSYREGFPNVPMQAALMGAAVIATDINGCNEIVDHEQNGLLVPPKNDEALYHAMYKLRTTEGLREKFTVELKKKISSQFDQKFVWDTLLNEYLRRLEKLEK